MPIIKIEKHPVEEIYVFKLMSEITKNVLHCVIDGKRFSKKSLPDAIGKIIKTGYSQINTFGKNLVSYHCDEKSIDIFKKTTSWEIIAEGS